MGLPPSSIVPLLDMPLCQNSKPYLTFSGRKLWHLILCSHLLRAPTITPWSQLSEIAWLHVARKSFAQTVWTGLVEKRDSRRSRRSVLLRGRSCCSPRHPARVQTRQSICVRAEARIVSANPRCFFRRFRSPQSLPSTRQRQIPFQQRPRSSSVLELWHPTIPSLDLAEWIWPLVKTSTARGAIRETIKIRNYRSCVRRVGASDQGLLRRPRHFALKGHKKTRKSLRWKPT